MSNLQSISLFVVRLIVTYGIWTPAWKKFSNIDALAAWFTTLGIPSPPYQFLEGVNGNYSHLDIKYKRKKAK